MNKNFRKFIIKHGEKSLTNKKEKYIIVNVCGDMAQLVERLVRNEEASGSNPLISTNIWTISSAGRAIDS